MALQRTIWIHGLAYDAARSAVRSWIDKNSGLYEHELHFTITKNGLGSHVVHTDAQLDTYAIARLMLRLLAAAKSAQPVITAYTVLADEGVPPGLLGKDAMLYLPPGAENEVWGVTKEDNRTFVAHPSGKIDYHVKDAAYRAPVTFPNSETVAIRRSATPAEKARELVAARQKRVRTLALALLAAVVASSFSLAEPNTFIGFSYIIFIGAYILLITDHNLHLSSKTHTQSALLAGGLLIYGTLINLAFSSVALVEQAGACIIMPLTGVLMARPLTRFFVWYKGRNPNFDYTEERLADSLYFIALSLAPFLLALILNKWLYVLYIAE